MSVSSVNYPPLLLRQCATPVLSLEMFLPEQSPTHSLITITQPDKLSAIKGSELNYNRYILAQYAMYLYIQIFMTDITSHVYRDLLQVIGRTISSAWRGRQVTDRTLNELIRLYIPNGEQSSDKTDFVKMLRIVASRISPEDEYPGINDILSVVYAMYDNRPVVTNSVTLYRITLSPIVGYSVPALNLTPIRSGIVLNTNTSFSCPNLTWKFINALNIAENIKSPGDFSSWITTLATLALPLDPIGLTTDLRSNLSENNKTGIPFLNYLAMYLRQRALGFDYTLSRLADTRRYVMQQLHRFCGVGATCIRDGQFVPTFLNSFHVPTEQDTSIFSSDDQVLYQNLVTTVGQQRLKFLRELHYSEGVEAAKSKDTEKFSDDADPTTDTTSLKDTADPNVDNNSSTDDVDTSQTSDDTIGQAGDSNQAGSTRPTSTLLPLALPSENIDDHMYRLTVLRFVSDLSSATQPDVTAETLTLLKVWCGSLLFIASSSATKALISQLKLTGKMKEISS